MPFDEDDEQSIEDYKNRKKILTNKEPKKNIHDKDSFEKRVNEIESKKTGYSKRAAELSLKFKNLIIDKTLAENKNPFSKDMESEVLSDMIKLATEINTDPDEEESMGSLMWLIIVLKTLLVQRDKINQLEYMLSKAKS